MVNDEDYKKTIFQLNELIRHLLVDSDDLKRNKLKYWMDYWNKIENENEVVLDEVFRSK